MQHTIFHPQNNEHFLFHGYLILLKQTRLQRCLPWCSQGCSCPPNGSTRSKRHKLMRKSYHKYHKLQELRIKRIWQKRRRTQNKQLLCLTKSFDNCRTGARFFMLHRGFYKLAAMSWLVYLLDQILRISYPIVLHFKYRCSSIQHVDCAGTMYLWRMLFVLTVQICTLLYLQKIGEVSSISASFDYIINT